MFLNKDRHEKGKQLLGFASDLNTSAYKVLIKATDQILTSNQLRASSPTARRSL